MKKIYILSRMLTLIALLLASSQAMATDSNDKRLIRGYDGGMMLHAGYLCGNIAPLAHQATGVTKGIGGVIRLRLGDHWRVGTEGYTSSMGQLDNGSYVKTFWAGLLADYTWTWGRFAPYLGVTVGGGTTTDFLMFEGSKKDWAAEPEAYFHKEPFVAIDPFIGCDYIVNSKLHLTLKLDYLNGIGGKELYLPTGPRAYIGFIFCH